MAKNITILEGSTSKSFSGVNKLRVNNVGGGTSDWVPEDETQLTTKHISENGTYTASDDGYYGYSEVTVSGVGGFNYTAGEGDSIGGVDLVEGNEYDISADPETGEVTVESLPSYIAVAHQPNKTTYIDGEEIDTDGLVVQAYNADGSTWVNEDYPNGIIPISEIIIDPTIANIDEEGEEWTDDDGINAKKITLSPTTISANGISITSCAYSEPVFTFSLRGYDCTGFICTGNGQSAEYLITQYQGVLYVALVSGSNYQTSIYTSATADGRYSWSGLSTSARKSSDFDTAVVRAPSYISSSIPESTSDPYGKSISTLRPVRQSIAVNWNRPSDGQTLGTSFTIRVDAESESSGTSGEESGSGAGHSF